jgi:hypothetical protein
MDLTSNRYSSKYVARMDNSSDLNQLLSYAKSELQDAKYWSKPKGDNPNNDWEDYGKVLIQDILPEIKMGKTSTSEAIAAIKDLYVKMWKLRKNNESPNENAEKVSDKEWFSMLNKIMYMWDRRDAKTITGHVNVDRYFDLENAVKKFGGAIMQKKLDKIAGKEWVEIREPKSLTKNSMENKMDLTNNRYSSKHVNAAKEETKENVAKEQGEIYVEGIQEAIAAAKPYLQKAKDAADKVAAKYEPKLTGSKKGEFKFGCYNRLKTISAHLWGN